jgi:3-oxoacyl-ACP reductase-like protein
VHLRTVTLAALVVLALGASLQADRVRLRSGKVIEGMFLGGDSKSVRVLLDSGAVSEARIEDVAGVEFSARKPVPPAPKPAPTPTPARAAAPAPAAAAPAPKVRTTAVPAGTVINVRITQAIDVDASTTGQTFRAIVDDPVLINGETAIPRGAKATLQAVQVQQSGTMKGSDKITLKMHSIAFGGLVYEVASQYVETKGKGEGKRTARKVGGGAGLGAIIGGIAGGGQGAAIGAAVGGVTGAAVASGGEEHLKLPAETRLQFQLSAAIKVQG